MQKQKDYANLYSNKVKINKKNIKMADKKSQAKTSIIDQVAERILTSDNVLVALSKDPSVDELSAALGLTFILDKMGKYATAIFSGAVPNAIEFLEPEKTFETNTNSLQDFIIALDKEKADHLRYKIDGDYVKVFITPYKTTIEESDIEFSHGDYNVDLVVALNVANAADLDSALTEYGRIMHDASSINIHADVAGNFADLEWGDPNASSISEMIYRLSEKLREEEARKLVDKPIATALMAGIVAATNRFSNEHTKPETLSIASKLMTAGADQQLISSSIPVDILTTDVVDANEDAEAAADVATAEAATKTAPAESDAVSVDELEALEKDSADKTAAPAATKADQAATEATAATTEPAEPAPAPVPKPAKKADPTALEIRHGAVDFELDENGEEKIEPEPESESESEPESEPEPVAVTVEAEPAAEAAPAAVAPEAVPEITPEAAAPAAPIIPVIESKKDHVSLAPLTAPAAAASTPVAAAPTAEMPVADAPASIPVPEPVPVPEPTPVTEPTLPTAESVIVAPEVSPEEAARETHVAEPLNESDLNPEDNAAEDAIDAALQKAAAAAARQQAEATAQLDQMVAASMPTTAAAQNPVMTELATASGIKNIAPLNQNVQAPALPKDYSAMMNEALAEPLVAEPVQAPVEAAPVTAPQMPGVTAAPVAAPATAIRVPAPQAAAPVEYANALPMPDPNGILPPAPAPFAPEASLPVASPADLPTAQAYAEQIQATNPMVQSQPAAPVAVPTMPEPVLPVEASVAPIAPAVPEDQPTLSAGNSQYYGQSASAAVQGVNPVMQDQIYPSDPSAYHIPGM